MRDSPEFRLIERIVEALEAAGVRTAGALGGVGDDAAVDDRAGARVTSVDLFVDGVHFTEAFRDEQIGAKALAASLSDLAAMGARAREAYVGLIAPPGFGEERAVSIATGIGSVAAEHEVAVLGGDISAGPGLAVAVTVVGVADSAAALVGRGGARPGDAVLVSGELGGAAAGLELLRDPAVGAGLDHQHAAALRARQLTPKPQLALGAALAAAGATAMIDVSDGIVADAEQIASESAVAIELEAEALPLADGIAEIAKATGRSPLELGAAGEDYELLAAIAADRVDAALAAARQLGERLTAVGTVREGAGVSLGAGGAPPAGFDHLERH